MITTAAPPYEPVADICERLFGVRPTSVAVCRWHSIGKNGKRLRVAKVSGKILSKESYVIEYFENFDESNGQSSKPASQPKTRSEAARQKASDEANRQLDAMGI